MSQYEDEKRKNLASFWLTKAAGALDCAVQLTGDEFSEEISSIEKRCDELAAIQRSKGN